MSVTNYLTINGQLIEETTNGVSTQYMRDGLGSVIGTTDGSGNILNTYRYTPYGGTTYKTGSSADPKFLFAGSWGGRQTGRAHSEEYWRARHRAIFSTSWSTVDPLWPYQRAYGYCASNPISQVDPQGMESAIAPQNPTSCPPKWFPKSPPIEPEPLPFGPDPFLPPAEPTPIGPPPVGIGWGPICIIICGAEACHELCTYSPGHPTGPFTTIGTGIGNWLFPDPTGEPDPAPNPKPPHRKPRRPGCSKRCDPPCYRLDRVPPGRPHYPFPGDHIEWYVFHQAPNCTCYPKWEGPFAWAQGSPAPTGIKECDSDILR